MASGAGGKQISAQLGLVVRATRACRRLALVAEKHEEKPPRSQSRAIRLALLCIAAPAGFDMGPALNHLGAPLNCGTIMTHISRADADAAPVSDQGKHALLTTFYEYMGNRVESLGRRASLMMALLGSFLGFALAPLYRDQQVPMTTADKFQFILWHPSILIGLVGLSVLLWSETARFRRSDDLLTRIAFSTEDIASVQVDYRNVTTDQMAAQMIANMRLVGQFLKLKASTYNAGCALFVLCVFFHTAGF
jgi:hypothetical protein